MSKRYTNAELKEIIENILCIGLSALSSFAEELDKLSVTREDFESPGDKIAEVNKARLFVNTITLVSDVMHPAYGIAASLFPEEDNKEFIKQCIEQRKMAVEKGMVSGNCPCCNKNKKTKNIDPIDFSEVSGN
jgi:hypothetical protein